MTAYSVTRYEVYCNGRIEERPCVKHYKMPDDMDHWPRPAELRKLAAAEGWTHVRSSLGRRFDGDYCPDHKPEDVTP